MFLWIIVYTYTNLNTMFVCILITHLHRIGFNIYNCWWQYTLTYLSQWQATVIGKNNFLLPPDWTRRLVLIGRWARRRPYAPVRICPDDQTWSPGLGRCDLSDFSGRWTWRTSIETAYRQRWLLLLVHDQPEILVENGQFWLCIVGRE